MRCKAAGQRQDDACTGGGCDHPPDQGFGNFTASDRFVGPPHLPVTAGVDHVVGPADGQLPCRDGPRDNQACSQSMTGRYGQERSDRGDGNSGPRMAGTKQSRQGERYAHWPSLWLSWTRIAAETGICA